MTQENTTQQDSFKRIDAYSLLDFAVELEKAVIEGYRVSLTNEHYPMSFGTHFTAGMVLSDTNTKAGLVRLEEPKTALEDTTAQDSTLGSQDNKEALVEGSEQVKRGRKPRG